MKKIKLLNSFFIVGLFFFSIQAKTQSAISFGLGPTSFKGYEFNVNPVLVPVVEYNQFGTIHTKSCFFYSILFKQKGVSYLQVADRITHRINYLQYGLSYQYKIGQQNPYFVSIGVGVGSNLGGKTYKNGKYSQRPSLGRSGIRNTRFFPTYRNISCNITCQRNVGKSLFLRVRFEYDVNSYNKIQFDSDPKIYSFGIWLQVGYYLGKN